MRRSRHGDDGRLDELLDRLGDDAASLDDDALRAIAQAAVGAPRDLQAAPARRPRRLMLAWTIAPVAIALLVGSGLGFGLASSATPTGSAVTPFGGFGFVPARGWTVLQSGTSDASGTARAIAGNFVLPHETLTGEPPAAVPPRSILITVGFRPRGSPGVDVHYPTRELPLQISDAQSVPAHGDDATGRELGWYSLRAAVGGYNVDAVIVFGRPQPSQPMIAAAQRQLDRLVVAADPVTIFAYPLVVPYNGRVTLRGSVESGREGELVDIQAKDCRQRFFRGVAGSTTTSGGTWSVEYLPKITTTLRAVWRGRASAAITVRQRPWVGLRAERGGRFMVSAAGGDVAAWFVQKRVVIQQRRQGAWRTLRQVVLTESSLRGTPFTLSVPRGSLLRAVLPLSQARPCYLAGVSNTLRT